MVWIIFTLLCLIFIVVEVVFTKNWIRLITVIIVTAILMIIVIAIDYNAQTTDTEVWSGSVVDWDHDEEWDEWHPPVENCSTDSNGRRTCTTIPGYWEHHYAENHIKTSDNGWIYVNESPDGKKFNDNWPNDDIVLKEYWPKGTPTASRHTYKNKVNASYSIYKHEEIDVEDFPDLPSYPDKVLDELYIDRIVGDVPNKEKANKVLSKHNTRLNEFVPDPEEKGKMRSWKQVNIIFVNTGEDKPEEYGFALQDSWEGGNKNDFVISFSMNKNGKLNWVYPFSWSEVELLKLEVRDYMMNLDKIDDFVPVINEVAKNIEEKFERKEFADFDYLSIQPSKSATIILYIFQLVSLIVNFCFIIHETQNSISYSSRRRY